MKTLYLARHANAADDSATGRDHDRPLSPLGRQEMQAAGQFLKGKAEKSLFIICSDSTRTIETANGLAQALNGRDADENNAAFYLAAPEKILAEIYKVDDSHDSLLVVAHNPGVSELAYLLSRGDMRTMTFNTATIMIFTCDIDSWMEMSPSRSKLVDIFSPG